MPVATRSTRSIPTTGEFSVLAVIPMLDFNGGPINPVPTGVTVGADGNIYVGLLSGAPFPAGGAKVLQVTPDGTISDALTNLTMVVDVEFSPDGELYASEISENFLVQPPANGLVLKGNADGTSTVVVPDLFLANGIAFDAEGNLYVVVNTSAPAGVAAVRHGAQVRRRARDGRIDARRIGDATTVITF